MPTMKIRTPADYLLSRDCCSYGYFVLAPNYWDTKQHSLVRPFRLSKSSVVVARLDQPGGVGGALRVVVSRTVGARLRAELERQVTRMLRLDETEAHIRAFHKVDPRWKKSGRGRLFRSPTFFEDVVKTVTSCNVTWPGTVQMNRRLCEVLGTSAARARLGRGGGVVVDARTFPTASEVAATRVATLRARCRVGYRDARLVELARMFGGGARGIDPAWFEDPSTPEEVLRESLLELPGIGPYAANNIMQLLGRYGHLPLDTESARHGRTVLGYKGTQAQVMKKVGAHFAPFGDQAFRSYWFEMWAFYESKHGAAHTWERDSTAKLFTAALLNKDSGAV